MTLAPPCIDHMLAQLSQRPAKALRPPVRPAQQQQPQQDKAPLQDTTAQQQMWMVAAHRHNLQHWRPDSAYALLQQSLLQHQQLVADAGTVHYAHTSRQDKQQQWQARQQRQQQQQTSYSPTDGHAVDSFGCSSSSNSSNNASLKLHDSNHHSNGNRLAQMLRLLVERPASSNPALLTAAIKSCCSLSEVSQLFFKQSHAFNHIHTAATICHLPKVLQLGRSADSQQQCADVIMLLTDLAQLAEEMLHMCSGRELANMAYGFAAMGFYSRRLMELILGRCSLSSLKPQELSNLTWAVAKLGHEMHEGWVSEVLQLSLQHMQSQAFKPQEICNILWALAVMQRRCLLGAAPPLRQHCTMVTGRWKAQYCNTVLQQLPQYQAADVAMGLWALAVLGYTSVEWQWLDAVLARATELVPSMRGQHMAVVLWSVGQLLQQQQHQGAAQQQKDQWLLIMQQMQQLHVPRPQQWKDTQQPGLIINSSRCCSSSEGVIPSSISSLQLFASSCFPALQQLLLQQPPTVQLSCVALTACAQLQLRPPPALIQLLLSAAATQFKAQVTVALAAITAHNSEWFAGAADAAVDVACRELRQEQQQLQSTAPQQQQRQQQRLAASRYQQQPAVQVHDLVILLHALAKLSYRPDRKFLTAAAAAAALICWQHVVADTQHCSQQQQQQPALPLPAAPCGKQLSLLLWSLVKLSHPPSPALVKLVQRAALQQLDTFNTADVGLLLWALARVRHKCSFSWVQMMLQHFLARLDDSMHALPDMCNLVHALPHLPGTSSNMRRPLGRMLQPLLPRLAAAVEERLGQCGTRELVQLVQGFALLRFQLSSAWLQQHEAQCLDIGLSKFSNQELVRLLWSYVQLGYQPRGAWLQEHAAQCSVRSSKGSWTNKMQQLLSAARGKLHRLRISSEQQIMSNHMQLDALPEIGPQTS